MKERILIELYSHKNQSVDLLYDSEKEFNGQISDPVLTKNAAGSQTFSCVLPLKIFNTREGVRMDNPRWTNIKEQYKIRVTQGEEVTEFVLRDYEEAHSEDDSLMISINCISLAEWELGQIGFDISFDENSLYIYPSNIDPNDIDAVPIGVEQADIHFWMEKLLEDTGWTYEIQAYYEPDTKIDDNRRSEQFYEDDRIIDYNDENEPIEQDFYSIKERIIKTEKSSIWNITQDICETFACWPEYQIYWQDSYIVEDEEEGNIEIPGQWVRKIILRNDIVDEALSTVRYGTNLRSISRQVDGGQIVTKMYVSPLDNPNVDAGAVSIGNHRKNFMKEDYLLDFSWYLGEEREDSDIQSQQLLEPDLKMEFKASQYAEPEIVEHTISNTKDLIEDYKLNIRARNIYIENATLLLSEARRELMDLQNQYTFYLGQRDGAQEQINTLQDEMALIPRGIQTQTAKTMYLYNQAGRTVIRFSEVGIRNLPASITFSNPINIVDEAQQQYNSQTIKDLVLGINKTDNIVGTITEAYLTNGGIGGVQTYASLKMDIEYYPLEFYTKLIAHWQSKIDEANEQLDDLGRGKEFGDNKGLIFEKQEEIENIRTKLYAAQLEKRATVSQFEQIMSPFIREGFWEDTGYTTFMNKVDELTEQVPHEQIVENLVPTQQWSSDYWCFKIPNDNIIGQVIKKITLNKNTDDIDDDEQDEEVITDIHDVHLYDIIDIESIEVMNNDIAYATNMADFRIFVQGTDYQVQYGYANDDKESTGSNERGIYVTFYQPDNFDEIGIDANTRMYVRAKARGTDYYVFSGFIQSKKFPNVPNGRAWFSPLEQILTIDQSDVILSSIRITANTALAGYVDEGSFRLEPTTYDLIYGADYYTYKEIINDKTYTRIHLNTRTNVPLMSFDKPSYSITVYDIEIKDYVNKIVSGGYGNYTINCQYDTTGKYYYNDAVKVMQESSKPQVTYSINVADISHVLNKGYNFENWKPVIGTKIPIYDPELHFDGIMGFINSISFDILNPQNTQISITNYKDKFEDLFSKITAATIQLQSRGDAYEYSTSITDERGLLKKDFLQQSIMDNNLIIALSTDNDIVWDNNGIGITNKNRNELGVYGKIEINSGGIRIANSYNAQGDYDWRTAITAQGINASLLNAGTIDTFNINIHNSSQRRFTWNASGLYAYGEVNGSIDENTYVLYNQEGLRFVQYINKVGGVALSNKIQNADFSTSTTGWSTQTGAILSIETIDDIKTLRAKAITSKATLEINQSNLNLSSNHQYYFRLTMRMQDINDDLLNMLYGGFLGYYKEFNYFTQDGWIRISGISKGLTNNNAFGIMGTIENIMSNWSILIQEPMVIDLTEHFGSDTPSLSWLDGLPFFVKNYTYSESIPVYSDALRLDWGGLSIGAQGGIVQLDSDDGLRVFEPSISVPNGKILKLQLGTWIDNNQRRYGLRGLNHLGETMFEISNNGLMFDFAKGRPLDEWTGEEIKTAQSVTGTVNLLKNSVGASYSTNTLGEYDYTSWTTEGIIKPRNNLGANVGNNLGKGFEFRKQTKLTQTIKTFKSLGKMGEGQYSIPVYYTLGLRLKGTIGSSIILELFSSSEGIGQPGSKQEIINFTNEEWIDKDYTVLSMSDQLKFVLSTTTTKDTDEILVSDIRIVEGYTIKPWSEADGEVYTNSVYINEEGIIVQPNEPYIKGNGSTAETLIRTHIDGQTFKVETKYGSEEWKTQINVAENQTVLRDTLVQGTFSIEEMLTFTRAKAGDGVDVMLI